MLGVPRQVSEAAADVVDELVEVHLAVGIADRILVGSRMGGAGKALDERVGEGAVAAAR